MKTTSEIGNPYKQIDTLNIPFHAEAERENQCLVYCLKMVIDYIANGYPEQWVTEAAHNITVSEIRSVITINEEAGWVPDQKGLDQISEMVGPIKLKHVSREQSLTKELFARVIQGHLDESLPAIPIINAKLLRRNEKAGVHAVVAVGLDDDYVAFKDPWGYPADSTERDDFINAWDDILNQVITVSIGEQQTLSEEVK